MAAVCGNGLVAVKPATNRGSPTNRWRANLDTKFLNCSPAWHLELLHAAMRLSKVIAAILSIFLATLDCFAERKSLVEWTFNRPGDLQGWQPNAHLAEVVVTNGAVSCRAVGPDPIFELIPLLDFPASPRQMVEIRLRANQDGVAELFWSNTSTGRYGGFAQEKSTRFNVRGDNAWRTYRLLPGWQREGKIVRLRFDVYDAAQFDLASIRVIEPDSPPLAEQKKFELSQNREDWQWIEPVSEKEIPTTWPGGRIPHCGAGWLLGPPVRINTASNSFVAIRMSVEHGHHGTVFFATDSSSGLHSQTFQLEPDGHEHIYNVDLLESQGWQGTVLALGLQPSDDTNAVADLRWLSVGDAPAGPPQLRVVSFALEQALARAGLPAAITAILSNAGGETATNLQAKIKLPKGLSLCRPASAVQTVDRLGFDEEKTLTWQVQSREPLENRVRLRLAAVNAEPVTASASVRFTPRLSASPTGRVPEPKPVRGPFEVGVYYFPGWKTASQWQPLQRFPERKPVLGWYREGDPEVADWHIKWAVEHGITFFAYDWYWSQGARQLEHALHEGYFKARYRHLLKFCLLWANHNPPHSSSQADCLAVTRHWIENYFRRPEHLLFEGKPVMIIFAPDRLTEDLGSAGVKLALEAMRAECRRAGLQGLHLVACVGEAGGARRAAEEGYDAVTAYTWPGLGMTGEGKFAPYESLVEGYRRQWQHLQAGSRLQLSPLPICGGWDSRPWHGENNLVRFGRTPGLFGRHVLDAKHFLEAKSSRPPAPNLVLVEAWNEWGEGSYIEPHSEFGFGYLDALREVFTDAPQAHDDVTPADVGLGPYDVPPSPPARTAWEFASGDDGWSSVQQLSEVESVGGFLRAHTTGNDPAFYSPPTQAPAGEFKSVVIRMRLTRADGIVFKDGAQLFWRTSRLAESESASAHFAVQGDGEWHDYQIPVGQNPRWRGLITRLRLDPGTQPNIKIDLDSIRLAN
jgi:hypothetical protein